MSRGAPKRTKRNDVLMCMEAIYGHIWYNPINEHQQLSDG